MSKTIMRVQKDKENPYLLLNKTSINDSRLSAKAMGIHVYLLSLPDDWKIYVEELTKHFKDGRESISGGIKELISAGYILRNKLKNEKGQFQGYEYIVYEIPQASQNDDDKPFSSENGKPENGQAENGQAENGKPAATKYLKNKVINKQNNKKQQQEKPKKENVVVVSSETFEIKKSFSEKHGGEVDAAELQKVVDEKGIGYVQEHFKNFELQIEGKEIKSIAGFFIDCLKKNYSAPVAQAGKKATKSVPNYAKFDQHDLSEVDWDKFCSN